MHVLVYGVSYRFGYIYFACPRPGYVLIDVSPLLLLSLNIVIIIVIVDVVVVDAASCRYVSLMQHPIVNCHGTVRAELDVCSPVFDVRTTVRLVLQSGWYAYVQATSEMYDQPGPVLATYGRLADSHSLTMTMTLWPRWVRAPACAALL